MKVAAAIFTFVSLVLWFAAFQMPNVPAGILAFMTSMCAADLIYDEYKAWRLQSLIDQQKREEVRQALTES